MRGQPETHAITTKQLALIDKLAPAEVATTLRAPASRTAIEQIEQQLAAPLPADFTELLLWHDGQEWNAPLRESDNFRLLSADEIIEVMKFFMDPDEDFLEPWGRYWLPLLTNDSGDYVVIDAAPASQGELLCYWHDWDDRSVMHTSLCAWAEGLIAEFSQQSGSSDKQ